MNTHFNIELHELRRAGVETTNESLSCCSLRAATSKSSDIGVFASYCYIYTHIYIHTYICIEREIHVYIYIYIYTCICINS